MVNNQKLIAVFGGGECSDEIYDVAYKVGRLIAKGNGILICGGRGGVMEAACRGAYEEGGMTIGILPDDNASKANKWIKIAIPTGIGIARNSIIARSCTTAIAIDGNYGTLSEIAFCLQLGKPVFGLRSWNIDGVIPVSTPEEAVEHAFRS